jgi:MFS transporter, ACS family, allantoate permease
MTIPTGVVSTASGILFSYFAGKTRRYRSLVTASSVIPCIIGTALLYGKLKCSGPTCFQNRLQRIGTPLSNISAQLVGLYSAYFYWSSYVCGLAMFQANTAGHSKKSTVNSLNYIAYAVGNFIGPQTFVSDQAPKYTEAVIATLLCYFISMVLAISYGLVCRWENAQRDKAMAGSEIDEHAADFLDLTDKDNASFRYTI